MSGCGRPWPPMSRRPVSAFQPPAVQSPIGLAQARRGRDHAVLRSRAVLVADAVERREALSANFAASSRMAGLMSSSSPGARPSAIRRSRPGDMAQREQHVGDGSAIGRSHVTWPFPGMRPPRLTRQASGAEGDDRCRQQPRRDIFREPIVERCSNPRQSPRRAQPSRHAAFAFRRGRDRRGRSSLRAGRLVAFPTETVYGLGADATNARAVARALCGEARPRVQSTDRSPVPISTPPLKQGASTRPRARLPGPSGPAP